MFVSLLQLKPFLSGDESPVNTILLYARDEMCLDELKLTCEQTLSTLGHLVRCPKVMTGGGWIEYQLSHHLRYGSPDDDTLKKLQTTKSQYQAIVEKFAQCLEAVARQLNPLEHMLGERLHLKDSMCDDTKPHALDLYVVKVNALSTATELANACLRVANVIGQ
jgi:chaperonin GroEL (HSP60 family)